MNKKKYLLFGFAIFLIAGIFASYGLGDPEYSIKESYSKGGDIQGWINMSFDNEPANSLFDDGQGNETRLIDLLETDIKHDYTCAPENCESFYSAASGEQIKIISLNADEEKLIGFKLNSDMSSIKDFSLTIESDALETSVNQLKIDLFNNGINELGNTEIGGEGDRDYGCFYLGEQTIGEIPLNGMFCERIHLPEAPGFELGAWVRKESGSLDLTMELYKDGWLGDQGASCSLDPATQGSTISCDINYLVTKEDDYYVCLYESNENYVGGEYWIKAYLKDQCGFKGNPSQGLSEAAAYRIFAGAKTFGDFGTLEITDQLPNGDSIAFEIDNYIQDKYGNLDCSENGCIIPVKLTSGVQQEITLKNLELIFEIPAGTFTETSIYEVSESPALANAPMQKIYLDKANFSVPNDVGKYDFTLNFDGDLLFTQEVEVKKGFSINSISPVKTAASLPTTFRVRLDIPENITITEYKWDFGDSTIVQTTSTSQVKHTYNATGSYSLTITVEDSEGTTSSRAFNIEVGSAKDVLDDIITEKQEDLADIQEQLLTYDLFSISAIENVLDLNNIDEKLTNISSNYLLIKDTGTEQDYQALLSQLLEIDLPKSIGQTLSSAPLVFYSKKENIDLDVISLIAGGDYGNLYDEYQDAILGWNINNMQTTVSVKEFSANYGFGEEALVKVFKIDMKDSAQETPYFFIEDMENLQFKNNLTEDSGYYYKDLSGSEIVEFYTTQDIDFEELPLFISPSLSSLSVVAGGEPEKAGKKFNWLLFIIIIIFVILIGLAIYFLLKKWYKEKYENYLFKNKNDLYNMVIYIQNAKQQGKDDKSIAKDLRKAKWNNEQISYVMKKYAGKKTGMPSFPKKSIPQQKIVKKSGNYPAKRKF